ncbi:hypothetical protein ZIOFF_012519 [Zingiber officinale]|uniref:Rhamnogalacturonase A/B/Epimerase-like pectate lyase domain-containing protein n=1 Tax=Zingiber officinale TaxID=94328 RepID=A0A8J5I039_ZINOF|nr:hypothetical protein ZIOFF_012519 [Zingiber officinale]
MAMKMKLVIFLCFLCRGVAPASASGTYNVMDFGAKADGTTDDSQAFLAAWKEACNSSGQAKVLVPVGTYFLNPVEFRGPCPGVQDLTFQFQASSYRIEHDSHTLSSSLLRL